jgi:hypothetical protein
MLRGLPEAGNQPFVGRNDRQSHDGKYGCQHSDLRELHGTPFISLTEMSRCLKCLVA